ncbi:MAG: hypothetical protein ACE366_00515 [Bradymonadia bacterium]
MRAFVLFSLFCLLNLNVLGCGSRPEEQELYDSTAFNQKPVTEKDREALTQHLQGKLKSKTVVVRTGGKNAKVPGKALKGQPLAVLQALFVTGQKKGGNESDLIIEVKGKGRFPVTVRRPKKGNITVILGKALKAPNPPSKEKIASKYATGPLKGKGGSDWGKSSRAALVSALELLGPKGRKLLVKLPIIRAPRGKDRQRGGEHNLNNCSEELFIYDRAIAAQKVQFVGTPERPHPAGARTILHEFGHVMHTRPGRLTFCRYGKRFKALNVRIKQLNEKVNRYNSLARANKKQEADKVGKAIQADKAFIAKERKAVDALGEKAKKMVKYGPVLKAYAKVLGKAKGPTAYGRTSMQESFAESFALYYADPAVLSRVLPKVHTWFKSGGHFKALN